MTYWQGILVHVIVGPCPCQGCGQEVIYVRQGLARGWLHANGGLRCPKPGPKPRQGR